MRMFLLFLALLTQIAFAETDVTRLRALVEKEAQAAGTRAVLFGMWQDEREVLTMALGESMTTVPADPAMHYRIGGISEPFLTTLTMMLAEQGRIDLEDRLSKWYPNLLAADQVTVRMLVANTAGYLDYARQETFGDAVIRDPFRQWTVEEILPFAVGGGKMNYPPGTGQAYSHTEYLLLQSVVEKAAGEPLGELYQKNIFGPMGLAHTRLPSNQEIEAPVLHAYSSDRGVYEDATYWNPSWAGGYGSLTSNLRDLGKWGPIFGKGRLVKPATWQEMSGPSAVGLGKNRPDLYFGYGFVVSNGWYVQNPNINGYSGGFAYNSRTGMTLVVSATSGPKTIDAPAIHILRNLIAQITPNQKLTF